LGQPVGIRHFVDVVRGDAATFDDPPEQTRMLCWPPYADGMAQQARARYGGARVIYIGEGEGGCTRDDVFHAALAEQWKLAASYEIPQWDNGTGYMFASHHASAASLLRSRAER
jgi:hypothetical protein